jgi:hypothetical protein
VTQQTRFAPPSWCTAILTAGVGLSLAASPLSSSIITSSPSLSMHSTNKTRPSLCRYQCGSVTGNIIVEFVLSLPSSSMHSTSQHYAHYNYSSKFLAFQTLRHHWSTGPCLQPRVGPSPALSSSVLLLELPAHHLRRRTPLASRAKTSPIPRHALDLTPASLEAPDEEEACLRTISVQSESEVCHSPRLRAA